MNEQDTKPVVCPVCGAESLPNRLFCSACGAYLKGEDEDTWVDLPLWQPALKHQGGASDVAASSSEPERLTPGSMDLHWDDAGPAPDPSITAPAYGGRAAVSESVPEPRSPRKRHHWLFALFLVVILTGAVGLTAAIAYRSLFAPKDNPASDGGTVTTRTTAGEGGSTTTQTTAPAQTTTTAPGTQPGRLLAAASWTASSTLVPEGENSYGASNVTDGDLSTCWSEGADDQGVGEWIRLGLHEPATLAKIEIANGYQKDERRFGGNPRVATLLIEYSTGETQTVQLYDSMGYQIVTSPAGATEWVRFEIQSTYPGDMWDDTSISEIRLYEAQ